MKITDKQRKHLRAKLESAKKKLFIVGFREGQTRRVKVFIAPCSGTIQEVTLWLKLAGVRMDKHERAIIQGHGFSARDHVVQLLEQLADTELSAGTVYHVWGSA